MDRYMVRGKSSETLVTTLSASIKQASCLHSARKVTDVDFLTGGYGAARCAQFSIWYRGRSVDMFGRVRGINVRVCKVKLLVLFRVPLALPLSANGSL